MRTCFVLLTTGESSDAEDQIVCVYGYKPRVFELMSDTNMSEESAKILIKDESVYIEDSDINGYILKKTRLYE
jgi:hypothetical protein